MFAKRARKNRTLVRLNLGSDHGLAVDYRDPRTRSTICRGKEWINGLRLLLEDKVDALKMVGREHRVCGIRRKHKLRV